MPVNDIFQSSINWDIAGEPAANVVHFRQSEYDGLTSRPALCVILLGLISDSINTFFMPDLGDVITLPTLDCFVVNDPLSEGATSPALTGGDIGDIVSRRTAVVVKKLTGLRGRSFRGRMFLPPPTEGRQANGEITPTYQGIIETWLTDFVQLDDGAGNVFRFTVFSPTLSTFPAGPFIDNPVSNLIVHLTLGSIRGRQDVG